MSTINNSDLLLIERDGNPYQIAYDKMSTLNDDDLFCVERDGVSYKVEAQYVNILSGTIHTPVEVLTPLDGAGVGGDRTFTPMSSEIVEINHGGASYSTTSGITMRGLVYGTTGDGVSKYFVVGDQIGMNPSLSIFYTQKYGLLTARNPDSVGNPWSLRDLGNVLTISQWGSVASGGGKVVALSRTYNDSQKIAVNSNGYDSFEEKNVSLNNHEWTSITYGGGRFVAVAEYGNDAGDYRLAAYSTDGENWTLTSQNLTPSFWRSVTYGDGKFVAVAYGNYDDSDNGSIAQLEPRIMYSTDGNIWTDVNTPASDSIAFESVTYGDGKFVAVGHPAYFGTTGGEAGEVWGTKCIAYSSDAINWNYVSVPSLLSENLRDIAYGNGRFVAGGVENGVGNRADSSYFIITSTDAINWSGVEAESTFTGMNRITFGDMFVAIAEDYKSIYYSTDGLEWKDGIRSLVLSNENISDFVVGSVELDFGSTTAPVIQVGNAYYEYGTQANLVDSNSGTSYGIQNMGTADPGNWIYIRWNNNTPWHLGNGKGEELKFLLSAETNTNCRIRVEYQDGVTEYSDAASAGQYLTIVMRDSPTTATGYIEAVSPINNMTISVSRVYVDNVLVTGPTTYEWVDDPTFTSTDTTLSTVFSGGEQVRTDVTGEKTGYLESDPVSNIIRLRDINNTANNDDWQVGERVVKLSQITEYAPGPSEIVFTSQNASTTPFSGTDATLSSRTWTLETRSTESDPWSVVATYDDFDVVASQDGSTEWTTSKPTLQPNTMYRVKVQYNSTNAQKEESTYHTFTTGSIQ
jgi:hypothetical protein